MKLRLARKTHRYNRSKKLKALNKCQLQAPLSSKAAPRTLKVNSLVDSHSEAANTLLLPQ